MKTLIVLMALSGALNQPVNQAAPDKKANHKVAVSERNIVPEAADGGRVEAGLGRLAQQKGASGR